MLQSPSVLKWLDGIEPAWALLEFASFNALRHDPVTAGGPIRLATDLVREHVEQSPVVQNTRILLDAALIGPGLKMTATGNLSRSVIAHFVDAFIWPDFEKTYTFRFHKVVNEPDFLPLFFTRHVAQGAKRLRQEKEHLVATVFARRPLDPANVGTLQSLLFQTAFWFPSLSYLAQGLHDVWPQHDFGVVLWCLSVAAADWQTPERLTRLCTVPTNGVLSAAWDSGSMAMEARILQPLAWFGLMEHRQTKIQGPTWGAIHHYRKTPLFDRFLSFTVALEIVSGNRH